jgi:hypothetical protein
MKHQVLAVVVGSLIALPAVAMPPEDASYTPSVSASAGNTRDQARGETVLKVGPGRTAHRL